MPVTLPPISRRRFLNGSLAAATAAALSPRWLSAQDAAAVDPHRFALLSDTHIHADPNSIHKTDVNPYANLAAACREICALAPKPAAVLHSGDCANHAGNPGDYVTFLRGLEPLRASGLSVHIALGNHDHRANFFAALPPDARRDKTLSYRQTLLVEAPRANLFLLDSLDVTNKTPGVLGKAQLNWLAKQLDTRADKPAIVFVHHDPHDPKKEKLSGLTDTQAFWDTVLPRKQVKAYVFGHTHDWTHRENQGLHLVNLPPTAWLFKEGKPRGWVDLTLREDGATFELRSLDAKHPQHGEKLELKWRA
jgi:hypothetical protein